MTEHETKTPGDEEKQDEEEQNLNTTNIKQYVYNCIYIYIKQCVYIYIYYIRVIVRLCIACPFCTWMLSVASDSPWGSASLRYAPLLLRGHSMDSKESKISLGLDSNMTHEPHQAGLLDPTPLDLANYANCCPEKMDGYVIYVKQKKDQIGWFAASSKRW